MNKKLFLSLALTLVVLTPVLLIAQDAGVRGQNQDQGQDRGRGQDRAGRQPGGMQMRGGPTPGMLLNRNDVQKELKLTAPQKESLTKLNQEMRETMQSMFQNGGGGGDRQAMMDQMRKVQDDQDKKALAVLDETQKTRLMQISIQMGGPRVVLREDIQKELKITSDQKQKIDAAIQKLEQANRALGDRMRNGEVDREKGAAAREANEKALQSEINKVLTATQLEMLKTMSGAPFKADPNERAGGRGGFGGGGAGRGGAGRGGGTGGGGGK